MNILRTNARGALLRNGHYYCHRYPPRRFHEILGEAFTLEESQGRLRVSLVGGLPLVYRIKSFTHAREAAERLDKGRLSSRGLALCAGIVR